MEDPIKFGVEICINCSALALREILTDVEWLQSLGISVKNFTKLLPKVQTRMEEKALALAKKQFEIE